jgi:hypothetical protein
MEYPHAWTQREHVPRPRILTRTGLLRTVFVLVLKRANDARHSSKRAKDSRRSSVVKETFPFERHFVTDARDSAVDSGGWDFTPIQNKMNAGLGYEH